MRTFATESINLDEIKLKKLITNMTKTILSLLFTLCTLSVSAANKPVIWEKPIYLSTSIDRLQLNSVEFHDTATIVKASITNPEIYIGSSIHLYGEEGKNYKLKFIKEFKPNSPIPVDEKGVASMTLVFEPMPLNTTFFDMLEGFTKNSDWTFGISDAKTPVKIKPYKLNEEKVEAFRKDFFRTDTACIKGKIEGYSRSLGYNTLNIIKDNVFTGEDEPISIDINEDGTFERKFILHFPILNGLNDDNRHNIIMFLIKPGQTLNFTINQNGEATVKDSSGNPSEYSSITSRIPFYNTEKKFYKLIEKANQLRFKNYARLIEDMYEKAAANHDYLADRFHYNDIEYIMEKINIQMEYAFYISYYYMANNKVRMSGMDELPDSLKDVIKLENYSFMRMIRHNDILALSMPMYQPVTHLLKHGPVYNQGTGYYKDTKDGRRYIFYKDSIVDSVQMCIDKAIFGGNEVSLPMKIQYLNEFYRKSRGGNYDFITFKSDFINRYPSDSVDIMVNERIESIKRRTKNIKAVLNNPMFESLLDEYVNYGLNNKQMSYNLPDCEATTILRKITDKYKGKYVYIDFWATYCGPCRDGIEKSKAWREELRNNPDFEFIFITGDKDSPKKDFDEYASENLNGAEVYRIPQDEYNKLKELFKFSGIPHYEALDRNGNVLKINKEYGVGKEQFLKNIELLKKLEK